MSLDSMHDLLVEQLRDIYSAELQIIRALPRMADEATNDGLRSALTEHVRVTKRQVERLDEVFETIGESERGKKCAGMEGLLREAAEALEEDGDPLVIDAAIIANAQRVEHYEMSAYGTARSFAGILGHDDIVEQLEASLEEEKEADRLLTELAETEVNPQAMLVGGSEEEEETAEEELEEADEEVTAWRNGRRR
jgi:ferritin-like metal-binding protein YciE